MEERERKKELSEKFARLSAPRHETLNWYSEHRKIDGFTQTQPEFLGSDRLLALETLHSSFQLGYDPRRAQSFIFVRIKSSVYDTANARHMRSFEETQMRSYLKTGNENRFYTARRRHGSSALLYKAENKPWTPYSLRPHLNQTYGEALRKTMPFLDSTQEKLRLLEITGRRRELQKELRDAMQTAAYGGMQALRAEQTGLLYESSGLQALLTRKSQQSLLFFRRVNYAFDIQKAQIFSFYRELRLRSRETAPQETTAPPPTPTPPDEGRGKKR